MEIKWLITAMVAVLVAYTVWLAAAIGFF